MIYKIDEFRHERDSSIAVKITSSAAAAGIINSLHKNGLDNAYNYIYRSSCPELTSRTAPEMFRALNQVCEMFEVTPVPKIYVTRDYVSMVSVRGSDEPFFIFSSEYLRKLDGETLLGVLAGQAAAISSLLLYYR